MSEKKNKSGSILGKLLSETLEIDNIISRIFEGKKIIQIGCNRGARIKEISRDADSIHIVDTSYSDLEFVKKRNHKNKSISFEIVTGYESIETDNKFDGLYCLKTLSSFRLENFNETIKNIFSLVKDGSPIIIIELNYEKLYNEDNKYVNFSRIDSNGNSYYKSESEKETLRNSFKKNELELRTRELISEFKWFEYEYHWVALIKK